MPPITPAPGALPALRPQRKFPAYVAADQVDQSNAHLVDVLERMGGLSPADTQVLRQGISVSPQAAAILKQLFPEMVFIIELILRGKSLGAAAAPGDTTPGALGTLPSSVLPAQPLQFSASQPKTKLSEF